MTEYRRGYEAALDEMATYRIKNYKQTLVRREQVKRQWLGMGLIGLGIVAPLTTGDATISIILIPLGISIIAGRFE